MKTIYTIGYSTHSIEEFIVTLQAYGIQTLADIRRYPGSKRYPHFNGPVLAASLQKEGINYIHFEALGGRRQPKPDSKNTVWRHAAFRGYADYMETAEFKKAIQELEALAIQQTVVYMCSEAVWWRCHRALVSDYLKAHGWKVEHILSLNKVEEHPYTAPAREKQGKLF